MKFEVETYYFTSKFKQLIYCFNEPGLPAWKKAYTFESSRKGVLVKISAT